MADFPDSILVTEIPRQIVEAEIELLIGLLDELDANPDLEDGADIENDSADDEPLHGAPEQQTGAWKGIDATVGCAMVKNWNWAGQSLRLALDAIALPERLCMSHLLAPAEASTS